MTLACKADRVAAITIVLADDHAMTLAGMALALEAQGTMTVVGQARDGIEAVSMVKQHRPDLAIFDYAMPLANGHEAFAEARRWAPDTRFIISTGHIGAARSRELIDAGLDGILLKTMAPDAICEAVARIAAGERVFDGRLSVTRDEEIVVLTVREREVLECIARGHSNSRAAERLSLSPKTIESHRTSLMRKLDVNNTATLIVTAVRAGLLDV